MEGHEGKEIWQWRGEHTRTTAGLPISGICRAIASDSSNAISIATCSKFHSHM